MIKVSGAIGLAVLLLLVGPAYAQDTKGEVRNPSPREMEAVKEHSKGTEQMLAKKYEEAIVFFRRAIDLNPDFAEAYYNLGVAYEELGKHEDSVETLKKAIRLTPENANAHYALGYAYYQLKRYKESVDALERSLALKPGNAFARKKLGSAYLAMGNKEKAREQYLQLASMNSALADDLRREIEAHK
jgi:tetratricopeptide (TPR) repeat protein